ncbi:unnamed protein product [Mytilus coruscus]|uniref:Uncharacterized protein n=1 Tax=Mytilus coruscus TaxID=42192 RepID=A0A6J8B6V5_MYTCO|nr:unnamed protein product [Mytilus coruscus]
MACKPLKPKPVRRKIFLWKKAEIHKIKEDLQNFITTFKNIKDRSVESLWQAFKTAVQTTIEKRVPSKMTQGRNTHPWINTTIRRKINQKQKAHKKARKTKKKRDKDRRLAGSSEGQPRILHILADVLNSIENLSSCDEERQSDIDVIVDKIVQNFHNAAIETFSKVKKRKK